MWKCEWCGAMFDEPDTYNEYHGDYTLRPEVWACCPECGSTDFGKVEDEDE